MHGTSRSAGLWGTIRSLPRRTPLRVKLITAVLALVAIALVVISVAGISILRSYLLDQADAQISHLHDVATSEHHRFGGGGFGGPFAPEKYVLQAIVGNGQVLAMNNTPSFGQNGPDVPDSPAWLNANAGKPVTVSAISGNDSWRIAAYPGRTFPAFDPDTGVEYQINGTLVVGVDVTGAYNTISRLTTIDLIVSVLLLILICIIGIAVVRASLRPLTDIEETAGAIAAGDLTRRVPESDPRTEVGRLGRSLNAMLSQIEAAFAARAASELAARRSEERMRQFVADASHELRTPLTAIRGFAEYYRQRGGVAELPGGGAALPAGADSRDTAPRRAAGPEPETGPLSHWPDSGAQQWADTGPHPVYAPDLDVEPAQHSAAAGQDGAGTLARADLERIMRRVEQESARMSVLVEDMLLLARLDQQRPLEQQTVDMLTLAADAVHDARVVAPDRNISLAVGSGAALLVIGDEVRLRQVVGNLVNNAVTHTPEGSPIEVMVRSGSLDEWRGRPAGGGNALAVARAVPGSVPAPPPPTPEPGPARGQARGWAPAQAGHAADTGDPYAAVVLEVADHGAGLTQEQAEHVFERFYRADQARSRQAGGTGLGLAIVAALVAAHGGAVWVESTPGRGATFCIAIPLAPEARHLAPDPDDGTDPDILNSRGWLRPPPGPRGLSEPEPPPRG
jgi:two-component system, OmpR family, sensor kinase